MTHALASLALVAFLFGTAQAQQNPSKRSGNKSSTTMPAGNNNSRSNAATGNTQGGANGTTPGPGLTNDQYQGQAAGSTNTTTKVDAAASVHTGATPVKAKKKTPKISNKSITE